MIVQIKMCDFLSWPQFIPIGEVLTSISDADARLMKKAFEKKESPDGEFHIGLNDADVEGEPRWLGDNRKMNEWLTDERLNTRWMNVCMMTENWMAHEWLKARSWIIAWWLITELLMNEWMTVCSKYIYTTIILLKFKT